jgi:hypothetical protein
MTRQELNCQLQQIASTASKLMNSENKTYRAAQAKYIQTQVAQLDE